MLIPLPNPKDYDVSRATGFLPESLPLEALPAYFAQWDRIASELPHLILTKRVRQFVDKLPVLDAHKLDSEPQWQRAVSVLGFIAHAYVWSPPTPKDTLPPQLATPLLIVNEHYGLPPLATFAGLCLWNFRQISDAEAELEVELEEQAANAESTEGKILPVCPPQPNWLDAIASLTTFTGAMDESWFYLVSIAIEREGAPFIGYGLDAIAALRDNDIPQVVDNLEKMAETIDRTAALLTRMYEFCDPNFFFFRLRPFLAGWSNMASAGLPDGVRYDTAEGGEYKQYSGGSNGQSSLIQVFDILLNVEHYPTGERQPPRMPGSVAVPKQQGLKSPSSVTYLTAMREYMPRKHREFLEHLERVAEIREFVFEHGETNPELVTAYDACLATLKGLRSKHIQIVTRYIVMKSKDSSGPRNGLANNDGTVGTGGTVLIPFLKQARDEVGDASAGDWGRRLLTTLENEDPQPQALPKGMNWN